VALSPLPDHWLPGFNFNGMVRRRPLRDAGDLPLARAGPRRLRGCDCRKARRPVFDPPTHPRGEAAPGGRLVRGGPIFDAREAAAHTRGCGGPNLWGAVGVGKAGAALLLSGERAPQTYS
jgi:hypothetical protein